MLTMAFAVDAQIGAIGPMPPGPALDTVAPRRAVAARALELRGQPRLLVGIGPTGLPALPTLPDTLRKRQPLVEYSETYSVRLSIHRALSWAMIPLFVGSAYTGFQLRNRGDQAPQWTRDVHGPLAAGTVIVFGMNSLTGVWNLIEGRKEPEGRTKRLVHDALFLAAGAGFAYVTAAGDNIHASGRANHWHRDVALGSMGMSVVSWVMMALFK